MLPTHTALKLLMPPQLHVWDLTCLLAKLTHTFHLAFTIYLLSCLNILLSIKTSAKLKFRTNHLQARLIPLHLLCKHCLQTFKFIEFAPTCLLHTAHDHFLEISACPHLKIHNLCLVHVYPEPFRLHCILQHFKIFNNSSSIFAIKHKSSA